MVFSLYPFLNLIKTQIPVNGYGFVIVLFIICLATIGVCVFCAVTSVAALFNLSEVGR